METNKINPAYAQEQAALRGFPDPHRFDRANSLIDQVVNKHPREISQEFVTLLKKTPTLPPILNREKYPPKVVEDPNKIFKITDLELAKRLAGTKLQNLATDKTSKEKAIISYAAAALGFAKSHKLDNVPHTEIDVFLATIAEEAVKNGVINQTQAEQLARQVKNEVTIFSEERKKFI